MKIYSLVKIPEKEPVKEWVGPLEEAAKEMEPQTGHRELEIEQIEPQATQIEPRRVEFEQSRQIEAVEFKQTNKKLLLGKGRGLLALAVVLICVFAGINGDGTKDEKLAIATPTPTLAPIVAIDAYDYNVVALRADGTVVADATINGYGGKADVSSWSDIISVSAENRHVVGLKADGTVVATGSNSVGQCNVSGWTDIVAIGTGQNYTIGLKADNTVVVTGRFYCDALLDATDVKSVATGAQSVYCLDSKGDCYEYSWKWVDDRHVVASDHVSFVGNIESVDICGGDKFIVGMDANGKAKLIYKNKYWEEDIDVSGWSDLVAIDASNNNILGLRSDGTVVADGANQTIQSDVLEWTDIITIAANDICAIGVKRDGTIVTAGDRSKFDVFKFKCK